MMWVNRSYSTGEVRLTSPDPDAKPNVDFNMCSDWRDMERLMLGVRMMIKLQAHPAMQRNGRADFSGQLQRPRAQATRSTAAPTRSRWRSAAP